MAPSPRVPLARNVTLAVPSDWRRRGNLGGGLSLGVAASSGVPCATGACGHGRSAAVAHLGSALTAAAADTRARAPLCADRGIERPRRAVFDGSGGPSCDNRRRQGELSFPPLPRRARVPSEKCHSHPTVPLPQGSRSGAAYPP